LLTQFSGWAPELIVLIADGATARVPRSIYSLQIEYRETEIEQNRAIHHFGDLNPDRKMRVSGMLKVLLDSGPVNSHSGYPGLRHTAWKVTE